MTDEEKRQLWLKRILPALAILVLYFSFISHRISDAALNAKQEEEQLLSRGIMADAISPLQNQRRQLIEQIERLKGVQGHFAEELRRHAGFLREPSYAKRVTERVASLLERHGLHERGNSALDVSSAAPKTIRELSQNLGQQGAPPPPLLGRKVEFTGGYAQVYQAMNEMAQGEDPVLLPVALDMQTTEDDPEATEWTLLLWTGQGG